MELNVGDIIKMKNFALEIFNTMRFHESQNNNEVNELDITLNESSITVSGVCRNEYGGRYSNEDTQDINYDDLSNECVDYLFSLSDKYETDKLTLTF